MTLPHFRSKVNCSVIEEKKTMIRPISDKDIAKNKFKSICQDFASCGPEKETCVANQTLKDKNCLVPCDGLYADIEDGSLDENVMKGWSSLSL